MSPRKKLLVALCGAVAILVVIGLAYGALVALGFLGATSVAGFAANENLKRKEAEARHAAVVQQRRDQIEAEKQKTLEESRRRTQAKAKLFRRQGADFTDEQLRQALLEESDDEG
jgi:biopolymer transport protein ExbB/TolQ